MFVLVALKHVAMRVNPIHELYEVSNFVRLVEVLCYSFRDAELHSLETYPQAGFSRV